MTLHPPFQISSRLLPSVKVGNGTISIEAIGRTGAGRSLFAYFIDTPDFEYESKDLSAGTSSLQSAMESLLSFMAACGEAYRYEMTGRKSENADLFPKAVAEWCYQNSDELSLLALELEENKELIEI